MSLETFIGAAKAWVMMGGSMLSDFRVYSRETGESFGTVRAWSENSAISQVIADAGVSPYDADPSLAADWIPTTEDRYYMERDND